MAARHSHHLRVISYNVHGLRDDLAALHHAIKDLAPDVLLLQEAPRRLRWRHKCAALAHSLGLVVAAGGQPALGNLILVDLRVTVKDSGAMRFPHTPGRHLRGAAFVRGLVAGAPFNAVASHLGTDPAERPEHARLLAEAIAERSDPVLLGVDVNEEPGGPSWQALLTGRLRDPAGAQSAAPTFPAGRPSRRIDAVLVDERLTVDSYAVVDTPAVRQASDHLPVVADLQF